MTHVDDRIIMPNGKHTGEPITRMPLSYLKWMVQARHTHADKAAEELLRRGTVTPEVDITAHAIDTASLRIIRTWENDRKKDEGLHSWIARRAIEALRHGKADGEKRIHKGIVWVIDTSGAWPILKTVYRT